MSSPSKPVQSSFAKYSGHAFALLMSPILFVFCATINFFPNWKNIIKTCSDELSKAYSKRKVIDLIVHSLFLLISPLVALGAVFVPKTELEQYTDFFHLYSQIQQTMQAFFTHRFAQIGLIALGVGLLTGLCLTFPPVAALSAGGSLAAFIGLASLNTAAFATVVSVSLAVVTVVLASAFTFIRQALQVGRAHHDTMNSLETSLNGHQSEPLVSAKTSAADLGITELHSATAAPMSPSHAAANRFKTPTVTENLFKTPSATGNLFETPTVSSYKFMLTDESVSATVAPNKAKNIAMDDSIYNVSNSADISRSSNYGSEALSGPASPISPPPAGVYAPNSADISRSSNHGSEALSGPASPISPPPACVYAPNSASSKPSTLSSACSITPPLLLTDTAYSQYASPSSEELKPQNLNQSFDEETRSNHRLSTSHNTSLPMLDTSLPIDGREQPTLGSPPNPTMHFTLLSPIPRQPQGRYSRLSPCDEAELTENISLMGNSTDPNSDEKRSFGR